MLNNNAEPPNKISALSTAIRSCRFAGYFQNEPRASATAAVRFENQENTEGMPAGFAMPTGDPVGLGLGLGEEEGDEDGVGVGEPLGEAPPPMNAGAAGATTGATTGAGMTALMDEPSVNMTVRVKPGNMVDSFWT